MKTAIKIVHILKSYSLDWKDIGAVYHGVETFLPTIAAFVERQEPVRMVLPAFPFKSPNSQDKTLGVLPDLGEELALHHLNGLCQNVAHVYEHGAEVHITSDGLVYNGIITLIPPLRIYICGTY
jgi:pyoverdine/dityrosine biosynthesis protein Dit1